MAEPEGVSPKLIQASRAMAWLSTIGAIIYPALVIATFLYPGRTQWLMFNDAHFGDLVNQSVPIGFRAGALVFALASASFVIWALWSLRGLFMLYSEGQVFMLAALKRLNNIAVAILLSVVVGFLLQAPITFLLTWPNGPGHREISLGFGSGDVGSLFIAGVVLVIARVMTEARRVADENASFV